MKTENKINIVFSTICIIVYNLLPKELFAASYMTPWYSHLIYHFQHGNILHLIINIVAFILTMWSLSRVAQPIKVFIFSLIAASLASLPIHTPSIGASGIIYAMIGMYIYGHNFYRFRFKTITSKRNFYISVFTSLLLGIILPNIAGLIHIYSLILGILLAPFVIESPNTFTNIANTIKFILSATVE